MNVSSDTSMPDDMKIVWKLDLSFPDSYALDFPAGSKAAVKSQVSTGATSTKYTITQPWARGENTQKLKFDVVVTRNTCAVGEQVLSVQAAPSISTELSAAEIVKSGDDPNP